MKIFNNVTLDKKATLAEVISMLQSNMLGAVVILDGKKPIAIFTEGDVRRVLQKNQDMSVRAVDISAKQIITSTESGDFDPKAFAKKEKIRHVVIVDEKNNFKYMRYFPFAVFESDKVRVPVVIMAGGKGTRMKELTATTPKPLIKVSGKEMLGHIIQHYISYGFQEFYVTVNYLKEQIEHYVRENFDDEITITLIEENEYLGTAGSLSLLPTNVTMCIVHNGDVLVEYNPKTMLGFAEKHRADFVSVTKQYKIRIPFGVIETDVNNTDIKSIQEKPSYSFPISAGINYIRLENYRLIEKYLDMPNLILQSIERGQKVVNYDVHDPWLDVGDALALDRANKFDFN